MQYAAVVRVLSFLGLALLAGCLLCAAIATFYGEIRALAAFLTSGLLIGVICASVLLLTPPPEGNSRPRDGLAVLIIFWCLAPILAGLVFVFAVPGTGFTLAVEEAASSLTTTGYTPLAIGDDGWPVSLLAWRAYLHILGGLVSLTAVTSIFAAINLGGPGVHRTVLFTIPEGSFFSALPRVIIAASVAVGATIIVLSILLAVAGSPLGTAMAEAISVATTGIVVPGRESAGPENDVRGVLLFLGLLFSTVGLAVLLEIRAGRWRFALADPELVTMGLLFLILLGLCVLMGERVADGAGWAIAELSTSGLPVNASGIEDRIPLSIAVLPVLIGGSALSTAGGIKLARVYILMARAGQEFRNLAFRQAVGVFSFRGRVQPEKAIIAVWVYLVGYLGVFGGLLVLFALTGHGFSESLGSAAGTLSNAGHLVAPSSASDFPAWRAIVATLAMVLGRLEVLAAIPALVPSFWRR